MAGNDDIDGSRIGFQQLEIQEFITLSGHRYLCEHRSEDGWERQYGFLERRHCQTPVTVERRRDRS